MCGLFLCRYLRGWLYWVAVMSMSKKTVRDYRTDSGSFFSAIYGIFIKKQQNYNKIKKNTIEISAFVC